ncbi:translesion DNA synthesis-associated protein ImuA [Litorivicinus lipolyticus]|uniref:Translesion DNA synthesis-associated protein ImuA n=1 Tax=Litorivicinus lipolyticus TaxID=418701 RepID=A0A5Q2QAT6_9GAMM|nr:translesion DNA synthesis-associated protein ImuA [Litorivicinus lipolyticus]QGG79401.1 translesion DNA synthesis-associated protein ImuA [Litorivicinus lipolyticus]
MQTITLGSILEQGQVWTADGSSLRTKPAGKRPSGFTQLDDQLAQGGWPAHGITEIHSKTPGAGELQLILPGLQKRGDTDKLWVWLDPPHTPMPQALAAQGINLANCLLIRTQNSGDALWAFERCLQSGCVDSAMAWLRHAPSSAALRRLQMAAERGHSLGHLIHHANWQLDAGTHARIYLHPSETMGQVDVHLQRQRNGRGYNPIRLPLLALQAAQHAKPKPSNLPDHAQLSWLEPHRHAQL